MRHATILQGDVLDRLAGLDDSSFDACLTDPPYGLSFMGKRWDHGVPGVAVWQEVLRVLKPGAVLMAFGGTRTHHRLMVAIEDAGFEIFDCAMWLYGSGFPKSRSFPKLDMDGEDSARWSGYGTALKPAWEPIVLAMKPCAGTYAANALEWGVAGLNVDGGRIETGEDLNGGAYAENGGRSVSDSLRQGSGMNQPGKTADREFVQPAGRWPANLLLDEDSAALLDEQSGSCGSTSGYVGAPTTDTNGSSWSKGAHAQFHYADSGGASRFFFTAKASSSERNRGLEGMPKQFTATMSDGIGKCEHSPDEPNAWNQNHHPTLKPVDLTAYLAKLILPPERYTPRRLLVPFCGSGSEIIGGLRAGWDEAVGVELDAEYVEIAERRIYGDAPLLNRTEVVA